MNHIFKHIALRAIVLLLFVISNYNCTAQYTNTHYIAPSPWNYFNQYNELVVTTLSSTPITVTISSSDGTVISNTNTTVAGTPLRYRFPALNASANLSGAVLSGQGLIVSSSLPIGVQVRNIASDNYTIVGQGPGDVNACIQKGNSAFTSLGDQGIGTSFRVGYYANVAGANCYSNETGAALYTVMAINNNTTISLNGSILTTLNAGESYLFNAPLGSLVTSSNSIVTNSGMRCDNTSGCGDGVQSQVIPVNNLGTTYVVVRSNGNTGYERSTIIATQSNTTVSVFTPSTNSTTNFTLTNAGDFVTINNGDGSTAYTTNYITSTSPVAVYTGSADGCEIDMIVQPPIGNCAGSFDVQTNQFLNNANGGNSAFPYFGYVIIQSDTAIVYFNGQNLESIVGNRTRIGNTSFYIIQYTNTQLGNPVNLRFIVNARINVALIESGAGYSMSAFISSISNALPPPSVSSICTPSTITAQPGFTTYKWYNNNVLTNTTTSNTLTFNSGGNYTVTGYTASCGESAPSTNIVITNKPSTPVINNCNPNSTNYINNGSFESGFGTCSGVSMTGCNGTGQCSFCNAGEAPASWSWVKGNLDIYQTAISGSDFINGVPNGNYAIDMNGNAAGGIRQAVSLPSTGNYTISFNAANNIHGACTATKPLRLLVTTSSGVTLKDTTINLTYNARSNGNWPSYSINFNASATSVFVQFESLFTDNTNCGSGSAFTFYGPTLDNIVLNQVPSCEVSFCSNLPTTLTSSSNNNLQWNFNGTAIPSANNSSYVPTQSGAYTVTQTNGACASTSVPTNVNINPIPTVASITGGRLPGNAFSLDGVNDYLMTPNMRSSFTTSDVTIEIWFKANAAGVIVDELGVAATNSSWHDSQIEILSTGEVRVRVWNLSSVSIGTVSFGSWNHAVVRYDATNQKLDGLLNGVASSTSVTGNRSTPWANGHGLVYALGLADGTNLGSGAYFNGVVDEFRVWNVVRTNAQIQAKINSELVGNESGLVAYYNFNLGTASGTNTGLTTINDITSNAYHATLFNTALSGSTSNYVTGALNGGICTGEFTTLSNATSGGVWSSSNSGIASINSSSGVLNGVGTGNATITYSVTNANNCNASVTREVNVNAVPTITAITGASLTTVGSSTNFNNTTSGGAWSSTNTAIATVNSSGIVTGVKAANTIINYTITNANGCSTTVNKTIQVNPLINP